MKIDRERRKLRKSKTKPSQVLLQPKPSRPRLSVGSGRVERLRCESHAGAGASGRPPACALAYGGVGFGPFCYLSSAPVHAFRLSLPLALHGTLLRSRQSFLFPLCAWRVCTCLRCSACIFIPVSWIPLLLGSLLWVFYLFSFTSSFPLFGFVHIFYCFRFEKNFKIFLFKDCCEFCPSYYFYDHFFFLSRSFCPEWER